MDGLDDFEKTLAAEKAERDRGAQGKEDRREKKHRHHHHRSERSDGRDRDHDREREGDREKDRHREKSPDRDRRHHRSHRHPSDEDDGHRHKRSRQSHDDEDKNRHTHSHGHKARDTAREEEATSGDADKPTGLVRDSWMTAPSALDVDYVQRPSKQKGPEPPKEEPVRILHKRELNTGLPVLDNSAPSEDRTEDAKDREVAYMFGDEGSSWRMTKLKAVYTTSEQSGRPLDEIAIERFGSLQEFDDAREEKEEVDRRKLYGEGYAGKDKPTGELYRARARQSDSLPSRQRRDSSEDLPESGDIVHEGVQPVSRISQSDLNRLKSQLMKAKLRKAPNMAELQAEYDDAVASFVPGTSASSDVVLDASYSRMLAGNRGEVKAVDTKRGRDRGNVEANEDMTIEDMVREERRTRGQAGGEGKRLAERIAKDDKFDDDLEYLDENAEKLAKRVHKNEASLKNVAVEEFRKMNRILDTCPLCHHEDREPPHSLPTAPIISLGTRVFLTLPTEPELTGAEGGAIITPISHRTNLLECDDDEWEEIRNFMKSLTRMYHDQGREVVFYENAAAPGRRLHAALVAVPIPYDQGDTVPAFFRESMLSADEEWSQHKKIIDTGKRAKEGLGKMAFRRSIAKEMPYFHVWFTLDGGLGHIVEDSGKWPRGDLFAREILGGMLDCEPDVIKRQGRWTRTDPRLEGFRKRWRKFDWTRVLTEE